MSKTLNIRQFAALKRTAQNVYPLLGRKERIEKQMKTLQEELETINAQIFGAETGSRALTGGFNSIDLIERKRVGTGQFDHEGKEATKYVFVEKEGALFHNEEKNNYEILLTLESEEKPEENDETSEATTPSVEDDHEVKEDENKEISEEE